MTSQLLFMMQVLVGLSIFLQTCEFLSLSRDFSREGIWRAGNLPRYPFAFLFKDSIFGGILFLRAVLAFLSLFTFYFQFEITLFLWLSGLLLIVRFQGPFQGGADSMSMLTLTVLLICRAFPESALVIRGALLYLGLQVLLSYFISGVIKLRKKSWREGAALQSFLQTSVVSLPSFAKMIAERQSYAKAFSYAVILFELAVPVIFFGKGVCLAWMAFAMSFHLANVRIFGLNRFLWSWLAAYPAMYYLALI